MASGSNAPIIIKRKKVVAGGGHHGGAWKVAYADFVTAMMAFFMLMWLLGSTTDEQRKGIADYFAPLAPVSRTSGGSDGIYGGNNPTSVDPMAEVGQGLAAGLRGESDYPQNDDADGSAAMAAAETAALEDIQDALLGRGGESLISDQALRHVVTRLTDEGLVIEIFALPGAPIFEDASAIPYPITREIVATVAQMAKLVTNQVAVGAHVPAQPVILSANPVWPLTADRAAAVRLMLEEGGLDPARVQRLTGYGDRAPLAGNPLDDRNNRIEITLLRRVD